MWFATHAQTVLKDIATEGEDCLIPDFAAPPVDLTWKRERKKRFMDMDRNAANSALEASLLELSHYLHA